MTHYRGGERPLRFALSVNGQLEGAFSNRLAHCATAYTLRTDTHRLCGAIRRGHFDALQVRFELAPGDAGDLGTNPT